jgi:hypothetical protein
MSGNVNDKIAKALADLEAVRHADRAAVCDCLRTIDGHLHALEVSEAARLRFSSLVIDGLDTDLTGRAAGALVRNALVDCDEIARTIGHGTQPASISLRARTAGRWDLKELDNRLPRVRKHTPAVRPFLGNMRPASNNLPRWNRFDARPEDHTDDYHASNLDRDTVDRMIRNLGRGMKDFGPEPPMGGQPALR